MDERSNLILSVGPGGLEGVGPGVAGFTALVVAFVVMIGLAWLAWWTLRPAKRAARSQRKAPSGTTTERPHTERRDR